MLAGISSTFHGLTPYNLNLRRGGSSPGDDTIAARDFLIRYTIQSAEERCLI